jgi:hypothetical protein
MIYQIVGVDLKYTEAAAESLLDQAGNTDMEDLLAYVERMKANVMGF